VFGAYKNIIRKSQTASNTMRTEMQVPSNTIELLVQRENARISMGDMVRWAIACLEQGIDTPSLRILASFLLSESTSEADPYFVQALRELRVNELNGEELLRAYSHELAERIISGELGYNEAVKRMHAHVITPLDHPKDLMNWCFLWEGYDPDNMGAELSDEIFADRVLREAAKLISRTETKGGQSRG
jgi:hypothetical protein